MRNVLKKAAETCIASSKGNTRLRTQGNWFTSKFYATFLCEQLRTSKLARCQCRHTSTKTTLGRSRQPRDPSLSPPPTSVLPLSSRPLIQPWTFDSNITSQEHTNTYLSRFNIRLSGAAYHNDPAFALKICKDIDEAGLKPDLGTYNHLLSALSADCLVIEAQAVFEDMELTGIKPDQQSYNHLINVK
jgi:pentatricopeptide repeat protein